MDTVQLQNLLYRHKATKLIFGGVHPKNKLPWRAKQKCYIINLDMSSEPGSHWVAVFFDGKGKGEYFDSYGMPPTFDKYIMAFLNRNSIEWSYNAKQLQDHRTSVCGQYCVYFLIRRCLNDSMTKIVGSFSSVNRLLNDRFVKTYIESLAYMNLPLKNQFYLNNDSFKL